MRARILAPWALGLTLAAMPWKVRAQASDHGLSLMLVDTPKPGSVRLFVRFQDDATAKQVGATPVQSEFTIVLNRGQAKVSNVRPFPALGLTTTTIAAVDHSGSFKNAESNVFAALAHLAARTTPTDKLGLLFFGTDAHPFDTQSSPGASRADLVKAKAMKYEQRTRLYKFVSDAIERVAQENSQGFREVIVFTDGDEESKAFDWKDVLKLARDKAVRVSPILLTPTTASIDQITKLDRLSKIREGTGGFESNIADLNQTIAAIDAARRDRDGWYVVDADLCGLKTGGADSLLHVEFRGSQAFSRDTSFAAQIGSGTVDCPSSTAACDPDKCNGWHSCVGTQCVAKSCTAASDCGSSAHCDGSVCVAGTSGHGSDRVWPWIILAASVLGLMGLALVVSRGRRVPVAPPPAPQQFSIPAPTPDPVPPPPPPAPVLTIKEDLPEKQQIPPPIIRDGGGLEELPETHLVAMTGSVTPGKKWRLNKRVTVIGGDPTCDLPLAIPQLSGRHAEVQLFPNGRMFVKDNNSTNGTWVNGRRLNKGERAEIRPNDQVQLSAALLLLIERPGMEGLPPAPPAGPAPGPAPAPPSVQPKVSSKGKTIIYRGE